MSYATQQAQEKKRKEREQLLELSKKGYTPEFIKFAYWAQGADPSAIDSELAQMQEFTGATDANQVEVDGRAFEIKTLADQKAYSEIESTKKEAELMAKSAVDSLGTKVTQLDEAIADEKGLKAAVGTNFLGRAPISSLYEGDKQRFLGAVDQIVSTDALDTLIAAKEKGATFGALSDSEMRILKASATKFGTWEVRDKDGKITGYNVDEATFKKELNTVRELTLKAQEKAAGSLQPETQETPQAPAPQQYKLNGQLVSGEQALKWANENPNDPKAQKVLSMVGTQAVEPNKIASTEPMAQGQASTAPLANQPEQAPIAPEKEEDSIFLDFKEGFNNLVGRAGERADKVGEIQDSTSSKFAKVRRVFGQGTGLAADVIGEGVMSAGKALLSQEQEQQVAEAFNGVAGRVLQFESVQGAMDYYERLKETKPEVAADIEAALNVVDLATSFTGATQGAKYTGKLTSEVATRGAKATSKTAKAVGNAGGATAKFGTSQATGLAPETIAQVISQPGAFTAKEMATISRESVFKKVGDVIGAKIDEFSELGKAYEPIRNSGEYVNIAPDFLDSNIKKFGFDIADGKIVANTKSATREASDIKALQSFYDMWNGKRTIEADEFLNMRADLAGLAKYDKMSGKTAASERIAKSMRDTLNKTYRSGIEGLEALDNQFSKETTELKNLKSIIYNKDGSIKDNAISTIANLTGKGKEQKLARIKQLLPDIEEDLNILKAVEDIKATEGIKVGTYVRGAAGVGTGFAAGGPAGALIGAILTSPKVAVEVLRQYGRAKGITENITGSIIEKMRAGTKLISREYEILDDAVQSASKKMEDRIKNIKPSAGMSIKVADDPQLLQFDSSLSRLESELSRTTNKTTKKAIQKNIDSLVKQRKQRYKQLGF